MTNGERLQALIGFNPNHDAVFAALLDQGLEHKEQYKKENLPAIGRAAIVIVQTLYSTPNQTNNQTGQLTTYDRSSLKELLARLERAYGQGKGQSTIRALSW